MFVKRRINGEKLRAARYAAGYFSLNGFTNMFIEEAEAETERLRQSNPDAERVRPVISRPTYIRWEKGQDKRGADIIVTEFDYNVIHQVCDKLGTTPEAVTDPINEGQQ